MSQCQSFRHSIFLILLAMVGFHLTNSNAYAEQCPRSFSPKANTLEKTNTDSYLAYLGDLLQNGLLPEENLAAVAEALRRGQNVNPLNPYDTNLHLRSDLQVHHDLIEEYLTLQLDLKTIKAWVTQKLNDSHQVAAEKAYAKEDTAIPYLKMKFYRIKGGELIPQALLKNPPKMSWLQRQAVEWGFVEPERILKRVASFDLADIPVTEMLWTLVMKKNPTKEEVLHDAQTIFFDGFPIKVQVNHPVSFISFVDIKIFLDRINDMSRRGDPLLDKVITGHKPGDQYRLPTPLEIEFAILSVRRPYPKIDDILPYGRTISPNETHHQGAVAEYQPVLIDSNPFFDLFSSAWILPDDSSKGPLQFNFKEVYSLNHLHNYIDSLYLRLVREVSE